MRQKHAGFIASLFSVWLGTTSLCAAQNLPPEAARDLARIYSPSPAQQREAVGAFSMERLLAKGGETNTIHPQCILPNLTGQSRVSSPRDVFSLWHCIALTALAVDHIPLPDATGNPQFYQHFGPHCASWAMAMFHLTMFEVANAYAPHPRASWLKKQMLPVDSRADPNLASSNEAAALAWAGYTILLLMYPKFDTDLAKPYGDLAKSLKDTLRGIGCVDGDPACAAAARFGGGIAGAVFGARINDGSRVPDGVWFQDFTPSSWAPKPFEWEIDPVSKNVAVLGPKWGAVTPFILDAYDDSTPMIAGLDLMAPPVMHDFDQASPASRANFYNYMLDNKEDANQHYFRVVAHGGDPHHEPVADDVARNENQLREDYFKGVFWSYDGTAGICAPVRLYNQIADTLLAKPDGGAYHDVVPHGPPLTMPDKDPGNAADLAYYYYALNAAMADAGIVAWHYKYYYNYFRPVTGIRAFASALWPAAQQSNPNFGQEQIPWAPVWYPLGAQNTNTTNGYNTTPPFPAYPSGHSVFGGAFFTVLSKFIKTEHQAFGFRSDELNGVQSIGSNFDAFNYVRCKRLPTPAPTPLPTNYSYDPTYCGPDSILPGQGTRSAGAFYFANFQEASQANSMSRLLLGVHWPADADRGKDLGERIGKTVCGHGKLDCPLP